MMLFLASCQTNTDATLTHNKKNSDSVASTAHRTVVELADVPVLNKYLECLSKAVARSLNDVQVASMLHRQVLKRFDGDNDVLWEQLDSDVSLFNGSSDGWSSLVRTTSDKQEIQTLSAHIPMRLFLAKVEKAMGGKLHIYWYQPEKWDGKTTPLVAYTPIDRQLGNRTEAPAFDAQGNALTVNEKIMNERPVIVITRNERTNSSGQVMYNAVPSNSKSQSALTQSRFIRFRLGGILFNAHYEDIFSGDPEFVSYVRTTSDGVNVLMDEYPGLNLVGAIGRSGIGSWHGNGYWSGHLERSFPWDSAKHPTLYIHWFEEDPVPFLSQLTTFRLLTTFRFGSARMPATLPVTFTISPSTTPLQGWIVDSNTPASPAGSTSRVWNTGAPNVEYRFDPN
jgi:hypothetical protein